MVRGWRLGRRPGFAFLEVGVETAGTLVPVGRLLLSRAACCDLGRQLLDAAGHVRD